VGRGNIRKPTEFDEAQPVFNPIHPVLATGRGLRKVKEVKTSLGGRVWEEKEIVKKRGEVK
jgi:hypothetical protein